MQFTMETEYLGHKCNSMFEKKSCLFSTKDHLCDQFSETSASCSITLSQITELRKTTGENVFLLQRIIGFI